MFPRLRLIRQIVEDPKTVLALASNFLTFSSESDSGFWGGMSDSEEAALSRVLVAHCVDNGPIVEFGTLFGFSTLLLAEHKGKQQMLYTVDNFSWNPFMIPARQHARFTRRCLRHAISDGTTTLIETDIEKFCSEWKLGSPAMVFIDASHDYSSVIAEIEWACAVGAKVICGHDFSDRWPGVKRAVNETFSENFNTVESFWWAVM